MRRRKMKKDGICPYDNKIMKYENGENIDHIEYWWECECGRSFEPGTGKDITDYELINVQ